MFDTRTKALTLTPGGPELVRSIAEATDLAVFPIGGIDATNLSRLVAAGARRAAVSSAICSADDPGRAAATLRRLLPL
jgi:thiamine-phosphate pyrophosphorylase